MSERTKRLSRRNFLFAVGAGSAATAAAVVAKKTSTATQGTSGSGRRETRGYQSSSEHINNYYRTTKV